MEIPLVLNPVCAGFPSPAVDYTDIPLDMNKFLIKHPAATFLVRSSGDSMVGAGINQGDILIVDRSLQPKDGIVIVANLAGEFTVKRLKLKGTTTLLVPENPKYPVLDTSTYGEDFTVWGVVTHVIHCPNGPLVIS